MRMFSSQYKTAFLSRLSTLIVLQVLFVFGALGLLLFATDFESQVHQGLWKANADIERLAADLRQQTSAKVSAAPALERLLESHLRGQQDVMVVAVYTPGDASPIACDYVWVRPDLQGTREGREALELIAPDVVRHSFVDRLSLMTRPLNDATYSVRYRYVTAKDGRPLLLAAVSYHDWIISSRLHMQWMLLGLFAVAVLLASLTVYSIRANLKKPLRHLTRALEKSGGGDVFCLIESPDAGELSRLARAINGITLSSLRQQKKLDAYDTSLKESHLELIESRRYFATLLNSLPFSILVLTPSGDVMLANDSAGSAFGFSPEEIQGKCSDDLFTTNSVRRLREQMSKGGVERFEATCRRADGSRFPSLVWFKPVLSEDGEACAHYCIIRDISESKRFQEMMVTIDRYYTRGKMVGDIAHEINNYLAILLGNIELVPMILAKGDTAKLDKKLALMKDTVGKIGRFADGMLDVGRDDSAFEQCDINQLVRNMLAFLTPQNRFDHVTFDLELSEELGLIEVDLPKMQQLLLNLLSNAADALRDFDGERRVRVKTEPTGQSLCLEISDTGPGVDEAQEGLLFRERFSTKRRASGLGLVTCRKIVEIHGGTISYNRTDRTTFMVELPARQPAAAAAAGTADHAAERA
jgi:PAS domain S-box-containing protein